MINARSYFSATSLNKLYGLRLVLHLGISVKRIYLSHFLPAFNSYSNSCPCSTVASLLHSILRFRIINLIPISFALSLYLRDRLTLRRLTLLRNPWAYGVRVSHPHYRYSCQHGLLCPLQHISQYTFCANTMLSYHSHIYASPQLRQDTSVPIIFGALPLDQ